MYKTANEAILANGPFGDKRLNELVRGYLEEKDPEKKSAIYQKIERQYPGNWGENNTISEHAEFVMDCYEEDIQNKDDENGETFGDDLT